MTTRLRRYFKVLTLAACITAATLMPSCSNIDCPLDNIVGMTVTLYSSETRLPLTLTDTLTVRVCGSDTLLLNRGINLQSLMLPLRYSTDTDTLLLRFSNAIGQAARDTLFLRHEAKPHFENIDCPAAVFHHIQNVRWTSHQLREMPLTIDSVALINSNVNYDDTENLRVYLRATASE